MQQAYTPGTGAWKQRWYTSKCKWKGWRQQVGCAKVCHHKRWAATGTNPQFGQLNLRHDSGGLRGTNQSAWEFSVLQNYCKSFLPLPWRLHVCSLHTWEALGSTIGERGGRAKVATWNSCTKGQEGTLLPGTITFSLSHVERRTTSSGLSPPAMCYVMQRWTLPPRALETT